MVKVERTFPAPESLAAESGKVDGSYICPDVVEQLKKDFHNKCYICEMKNLQDPQVEHLLPHKNGKYKDRKFDWENLFWVCGHCNSVKNRDEFDDGILDCCKVDPEEKILFELDGFDVNIRPKYETDEMAVNTASLVRDVFSIKNTGMRIYKSAMRLKELQLEMNVLLDKLEAYQRNPESLVTKRMLKALLKRETAFAGFKRCYVREHLNAFPGLSEYLA